MTKFCKDCEWCDLGEGSSPPFGYPDKVPPLHFRCHVKSLDPVGGSVFITASVPCYQMRENLATCGPEGKWFKGK